MGQGVLIGLRVVELAQGIAGPVAAMQLGEAGAEVIKVEPPSGDSARSAPGFAVWNRGKKSVVLDLANTDDRAALDRLLASADVFIHDLVPTQAKAQGLDDAALQSKFPELVIAAVGGWPKNHPNSELPVRETLVLARLGLMDEQPGHRPGPIFIRLPFASWLAAWLCAIGVMARLIARQRGEAAGVAHTSLAQGALAPMTMHWARAENPSPGFSKGLDKTVGIAIHQCADGRWIHVHYSPDNSPLMRQGLEELGEEGVAEANARWPKNHTAPNFGANREIMATRPSSEWLEDFWANDVAAQPAANLGEVYFDPQAQANGYVVEIEDPVFGKTHQPGPVWTIEPEGRVGSPPPRLGADTKEVLANASAKPIRSGVVSSAQPPLHGVKVLDFGAYAAGPFGPMLLADLGADLVKVEPPKGDPMRYLERAFCGMQRGKRSVALALGDTRSAPALEALIGWADIVHYNLRRPAAAKLGLDFESLKKVNPDIIGCHVSSYGPKGQRADWPGYDQMFQSSCGWEVENGGVGNPPLWLRFGMCDHFAAVSSVYACLLALFHRDRTGVGQMVASSLLGATILTVSETLGRADGTFTPLVHLNPSQTGISNENRIYRCVDGWIAVQAIGPEETAFLFSLAGQDPEAHFASMRVQDAVESLAKADVPSEVVKEAQLDPFLDDPDNKAARLAVSYNHAAYGQMEQIGAFWDLGDAQLALDRPPPTIGQHGREVLHEVGLASADIARLEAEGVMVVSNSAWTGGLPTRASSEPAK